MELSFRSGLQFASAQNPPQLRETSPEHTHLRKHLDLLRVAEWVIAVVLSAAVLFLLATRATHAGGLWRDECGTVQLARMPSVMAIIDYFDHQTFPPLVPLLVRTYTYFCGEGELSLRFFGFLAGVTFLGVVWFNARAAGNGVPLLSLALLGLSPTFLVWGTTVGGYGFGAVLIVLVFAMTAKLLRTPTPTVIFFAAGAALVSQQLAIGNLIFSLTIALSALIGALTNRAFKTVSIIAALAVCCLLVGAFYLNIFSSGEWRIVLQQHCSFSDLWHQSTESYGWNPFLIWIVRACFVTTIIGGLGTLFKRKPARHSGESALLLYTLLVTVLAPLIFFGTLLVLSYHTYPWHYLLLLALVAASVDSSFLAASHLAWVRLTRLIFTVVIAVAVAAPAWRAVQQRRTNIDIVATKVAALSKSGDLIVVAPWQFGISFSRYYHGATDWITLPTMDDHRIHRYDLMMAKMISAHPIDDVLQRIHTALVSGNRVWLVGGIRLPAGGHVPVSVMPAPDARFGWDSAAYTESWIEQTAVFVSVHAERAEGIEVGGTGNVNAFENVPLAVVEGWQ